jgi:Family of unknown function (DUF5681)
MAGGRFEPGRSGNPAGKPPGARCKATLAAEQLLAGEAKALTRKCIAMALEGDMQAMRLCMERIAPQRRGSVIRLELPPIQSPQDIVAAMGTVAAAIGRGDLTTDEASGIAAVLEAGRKSLELVEVERRLAALETRQCIA